MVHCLVTLYIEAYYYYSQVFIFLKKKNKHLMTQQTKVHLFSYIIKLLRISLEGAQRGKFKDTENVNKLHYTSKTIELYTSLQKNFLS